MRRTLVLDVVGLTPGLLGEHTPALSALLLDKESHVHHGFFNRVNRVIDGGTEGFVRLLKRALRARPLMLGLFAGGLLLAWGLFRVVPSAFVPDEDEGYFITIVQAPAGASLEYTTGIAKQAEAILFKDQDIAAAFSAWSAVANIQFVQVADGGAIIALTTSMVRHAVPGGGPYTATKAAVESLVRSMAKELAARRVRVNAVAPGPVDTELFRAGKTDEAMARSAGMSPFNRVGEAAEVAAVVAFLASSKASWIHGQVIQPNGGMI